MPKQMILRIQSPEHGTIRIDVSSSESITNLYAKVRTKLNLNNSGFDLLRDRTNLKSALKKSKSKTIRDNKLGHGDLLFVDTKSWNDSGASTSSSIPTHPPTPTLTNGLVQQIIEDSVDQILGKQDGKITRGKNEQLCRHGSGGKCLNCVPLEPFDKSYLSSREIKFLSFHSYIRKLLSGVDKGKFINLENLSCKIKECKEHAPWPAGICTKCQPNAVTLNRQEYRHVDYISFENESIVDRFIDGWRESGCQRVGFLLGRYEQHPDVPLGIKATIAEIYEPPQISSGNQIQLLEDQNEEIVDELCAAFELRRVGWIFTDLVPDTSQTGAVKHTRGSLDTYFLSAEECVLAAQLQNKYPNKCRYSSDGIFGSKFVTVVVTGGEDQQIHMKGYQVSDQCMGLVRDNCLIPTYDAPELGYIKESSNEQYVPDVFYKEKDEYSNEVIRLARPLPVEYLLLDMAVGSQVEPVYTFTALTLDKPRFPSSNRSGAEPYGTLRQYCSRYEDTQCDLYLKSMSDFHLLYTVATLEAYPLRGEKLSPLINAIKNKDGEMAVEWSHDEHWSTIKHFYEAAGHEATAVDPLAAAGRSPSFVGNNASPLPPIGSTWSCKHCTYANTGGDNCAMCSLPRYS